MNLLANPNINNMCEWKWEVRNRQTFGSNSPYSFPEADTTNCHKIYGLQQWKFVTCGSLLFGVQKSRSGCQQGWHLLEILCTVCLLPQPSFWRSVGTHQYSLVYSITEPQCLPPFLHGFLLSSLRPLCLGIQASSPLLKGMVIGFQVHSNFKMISLLDP